MFTGLIEATGRVAARSDGRLTVESDLAGLRPGESVAVNGVCLTIVESSGRRFTADLSEETLARTTLATISGGDRVNLELPLEAGARMGGHIVQGHVDAVGRVSKLERLGGSLEMWIHVPANLARYLVEKGSVAVDGVSLTVARLQGSVFAVSLIPATLDATTLVERNPGDTVNIEVDVVAKYVERLASPYKPGGAE